MNQHDYLTKRVSRMCQRWSGDGEAVTQAPYAVPYQPSDIGGNPLVDWVLVVAVLVVLVWGSQPNRSAK